MYTSSLSHFICDYTSNKDKTTNSFYFATAAISILGLLTSVSYTAMYGFDQGITPTEKICNAIAYSLIDTMLALFFVYLGRKISQKGRAVQKLQIQFLGMMLFCLSTLAMVSDLSKQHATIESEKEVPTAYELNISSQLESLLITEKSLQGSLEEIDATRRPGQHQFLFNQLSDIEKRKAELTSMLPKPKPKLKKIAPVNSLNLWLANYLNIAEESVNILVKSIWAVFFIAGFTTVAGLHSSIYCDESLIWAFKRRQRMEIRAVKNAAKYNIKMKKAEAGLKKIQKKNKKRWIPACAGMTESTAEIINRPSTDTAKYQEVTKKLLTEKKNPTLKWLQTELSASREEAKMFLSWMILDGLIKRYANGQYRVKSVA